METQLSIIRDFSEVSWDEQTKRWSSYVWVDFILIRCFIAVETCKWLKQPEIGMCMLSLKVQKCDMLQKQKVANFASLCQISNYLTRVPEHDISNFDALGKRKLPQTHVVPEMSIFRGRICLHDSASSGPTVGRQTVKERYWKTEEGISYLMLPTCLYF